MPSFCQNREVEEAEAVAAHPRAVVQHGLDVEAPEHRRGRRPGPVGAARPRRGRGLAWSCGVRAVGEGRGRVARRGELHHAGDGVQLADRRGVAAALRVTGGDDLGPVDLGGVRSARRGGREERVPAVAGVVRHEPAERELRASGDALVGDHLRRRGGEGGGGARLDGAGDERLPGGEVAAVGAHALLRDGLVAAIADGQHVVPEPGGGVVEVLRRRVADLRARVPGRAVEEQHELAVGARVRREAVVGVAGVLSRGARAGGRGGEGQAGRAGGHDRARAGRRARAARHHTGVAPGPRAAACAGPRRSALPDRAAGAAAPRGARRGARRAAAAGGGSRRRGPLVATRDGERGERAQDTEGRSALVLHHPVTLLLGPLVGGRHDRG